MRYRTTIGQTTYSFSDLRALMAKASPYRSGDALAGIAADRYEERVAAQMVLADLPLKAFLNESLVPYENDEVTRIIIDTHQPDCFAPYAHFTVGQLRDWLLSDDADWQKVQVLRPGLTPEMVAAVSKIMRNQDLILAAKKCRVITSFRSTIGLPGHIASRLQPNHPTDDRTGIAAAIIDGLLYGSGDAVIGINPATDNPGTSAELLYMVDNLIHQFAIPTQSCVLCHLTTTLQLMEKSVPVDLVFQSIGGTEKTNRSFGINLNMLSEARDAALSLGRCAPTNQVMYFETGQGSALSCAGHEGVDQQTLEVRAYGVARHYQPFLVNSVVGFIGPEYLYDGKQITRAALEDHFCGKFLGVPMGMDVCYTNHAEADQDDMDNILALLGVAGCNFIIAVPGADDVMLNYQSTSFHDALFIRRALDLKPAPEFERWLIQQKIFDESGTPLSIPSNHRLLRSNPILP